MDQEKEINSNLLLLAKSSLIIFIGVLLSKIFTYLYRIIIAREFGPETYGVFTLATIVIGWFVVVSTVGVSNGLVRYVALFRGKKQDNKIKYLFRFSLKLVTLTSILASILLYFLSDFIALTIFHNPELSLYLRILSPTVAFFTLSYPFLSSLTGYERVRVTSFLENILQTGSKLVFLGVFIWFGLKNSVAYSYLLGTFVLLVFAALMAYKKVHQVFEKPKLRETTKLKLKKEFFSYSWPLIFVGIVGSIMFWLDSLALGYFKNAEAVGIYNSAVPIAMLLYFVPSLISPLFLPLVTREYGNKKLNTVKEITKQAGKWIFIFNVPVFILLFVFPNAVLNILFGSEYIVAAMSLRILSIGVLFASVLTISAHTITMAGKSKVYLSNIILSAVLNFFLNALFIPMATIGPIDNALGINGAAIATAISTIFLYTLFLLQGARFVGIVPLRRKMLNIFFSGVLSGAVLFYIRQFFGGGILRIVIPSLIFLALYSLLILATKSFDRTDIKTIKSIFLRIRKSRT